MMRIENPCYLPCHLVELAITFIEELVSCITEIFSRSIEELPLIPSLDDCIIENDPVWNERLQKIGQVFQRTPLFFNNAFENHALHHEITTLVDELRDKEDHDLQKRTFKAFLEGVQGIRVKYPDGSRIPLDFSREVRRLEGEISTVTIEKLDEACEQDLRELIDIDREGFTAPWFGGESIIRRIYSKKPDKHIFVARDEQSQLIGALIINKTDNNRWHIPHVVRKANAARLGVGEKLFSKVREEYPFTKDNVTLYVRVSNLAAIALYRKIGFEVTSNKPNYYQSAPREDAHVMTFQGTQN